MTSLPPAGDPGAPHLVGFDIETDTEVDGLDPDKAAVVAAAVWSAEASEVFSGPERQILADLDECLSGHSAGYLVTWNGSRFDLPFVSQRARTCGVPLELQLTDNPHRNDGSFIGKWAKLTHLDGLPMYRADVGRGIGISCGLKPLAKLVGIDAIELDRESLHLAHPDDVRDYVASDARVAVELVQRRMPSALKFADRWPPATQPVSISPSAIPPAPSVRARS